MHGYGWFLVFSAWLHLGGPTLTRDPGIETGCSIGVNLGPGEPGNWIVLVEPTKDSIAAPLNPFDWYDVGGQTDGRPAPADTTWGQVFRIVDVVGGEGQRSSLAEGEEIVVVPWAYDAACRLELWTDGVVWATEGLQVFKFGSVRRATAGERKVFDGLGWHAPYPAGEFLKFEMPNSRSPEPWLPGEVYFDLLRHLAEQVWTDSGAGPAGPQTWTLALEAWVDAHPRWSRTFPVTELRDRLTSREERESL